MATRKTYLSIFRDDGSIDWTVRDHPTYKRKVARELARTYRWQAAWARKDRRILKGPYSKGG